MNLYDFFYMFFFFIIIIIIIIIISFVLTTCYRFQEYFIFFKYIK